MARRARQEDAIHVSRTAEARAIPFPVVLVISRAQFGEQQAGVAEDAPRQQAPVVERRLGGGERLERALILEGKAERQRRAPLAVWTCDAVDVVGRVRTHSDVIARPTRCGLP